MRSITDQVEINAEPPAVFKTLITPSEIKQWWNAPTAIVLPKPDGFWAATWGDDQDDPDYIVMARISEIEPPNRLVLSDYRYHAKEFQPPVGYEARTEYEVSAHERGSILIVTQFGFPDATETDEFYHGCITGWKNTLAGIKEFLER